jgi:hypothetical protein
VARVAGVSEPPSKCPFATLLATAGIALTFTSLRRRRIFFLDSLKNDFFLVAKTLSLNKRVKEKCTRKKNDFQRIIKDDKLFFILYLSLTKNPLTNPTNELPLTNSTCSRYSRYSRTLTTNALNLLTNLTLSTSSTSSTYYIYI